MPPEQTASSSARQPFGWLYIRTFWASLSIMTMWLVVLFVGIFGDDFVSTSSSGLTKIPVVVFLLPFVLPGTIVIGRRAFTGAVADTTPSGDIEAHAPQGESGEPPTIHATAA